jgi:type IV secretory pathway TrbL component
MAMDKAKLVLGALLVFLLGTMTERAFGQAAAEAGLLNGVSATSTAHAASNLGAGLDRAMHGSATATSKAAAPVTTTVVHKPAGSKASAASTKGGHSGAATGQEAKSGGVVHVWPPDALNQEPAAPK